MTKQPCHEINEKLIEYVDGELPEHQTACVEDHLKQCESCRSLVAALERSLELAMMIWQEGETSALLSKKPAMRTRQPIPRVAALAATVLIVLGASVIWWALTRQYQPEGERITLDEINLRLQRTAVAAQDFAVAEMFAQQPGSEDIARDRYVYVIENYPDMEVAEQAQLRIKTILERSVRQ